MPDEKRYLDELSQHLDSYADRIQSLPEDATYDHLRKLLQELMDLEKQLREMCEIGNRFNVIRTQLHLLMEKLEKDILEATNNETVTTGKERALPDDEILVYIYLFNAQGNVVRTWAKLLTPEALKDHSINRPVYLNRTDILKAIGSKQNTFQHAYLEVAVKKNQMISTDELAPRDSTGFPLIKLKEGSLKTENIWSFFHEGIIYDVVNSELISR